MIGVGKAGSPASPPSEPDGRISRIRLSSRWSYPHGDEPKALRRGYGASPEPFPRPLPPRRPSSGPPAVVPTVTPAGDHARGAAFSPLFSPTGTHGGVFARVQRTQLHLPTSLRSTPVTALPRYYGGSDSCKAETLAIRFRSAPSGVSVLSDGVAKGCQTLPCRERRRSYTLQVSWIHVATLPIVLSPTTLVCPVSAWRSRSFTVTGFRKGFPCGPPRLWGFAFE
jgi:hypothetical protein